MICVRIAVIEIRLGNGKVINVTDLTKPIEFLIPINPLPPRNNTK